MRTIDIACPVENNIIIYLINYLILKTSQCDPSNPD